MVMNDASIDVISIEYTKAINDQKSYITYGDNDFFMYE